MYSVYGLKVTKPLGLEVPNMSKNYHCWSPDINKKRKKDSQPKKDE